MGWYSGVATYLILWWLVLFTVLPWGVRTPDEVDVEKGNEVGAPARPRLVLKMAVTTGIAALVWGVVFWLMEYGPFSFRS